MRIIFLSALFILPLICTSGEDYGGIASLCIDIYIRKPDGSKGYFQTSRLGTKNNYLYTITENGRKIYTFSSGSGSFIKTERWLRSPFPSGHIIYAAETDCLLKLEFYTSAPPKGDQYWTEMKMFVDDKLLPESSYNIRLETEYNFLPKTMQKIPYTYKRKKKTLTSYRNKLITKTISVIPDAKNGGVLINSYRRAIYTKQMKKGETFKLHFELKAVSEIEFK